MFTTLWPALASWLAASWPAVVLSALALAAAYRERGQGHAWLGTTGARVVFWALPVGAMTFALAGPPNLDGARVAVLTGALAYAGMAWLPHAAGQNLTETAAAYPQSWTARISLSNKLGYLAAVGIARLALIALPLVPGHPAALWLPLAGLVLPLAYLLGARLPALPWRLTTATEWGEALSGLGIGAALAVTLTA
ncbi:hypothetical protein [Azospirillum doebereinerae]|uniref:Uncharacterized protein n=1 Tax=Azospirillum doebereinerae TaxID=92933 RepID=A0A3S0V4J7_9PROT|nr:hypothetical protein [Azospirillum doebereinerae]RUQ67468.1 hypothetical protein EJ913_19800 [Azospirillum doebereinerae]